MEVCNFPRTSDDLTAILLRILQSQVQLAEQCWSRRFFLRPFFSAFYDQRLVTAAWATRSPWSIISLIEELLAKYRYECLFA